MNKKTLSEERGYKLVRKYVTYYYEVERNYFYGLRKSEKDLEDIIDDVYLSLFKRKFFKKWDSDKSSKKYYVAVGVKRAMIDMLRSLKQDRLDAVSLNMENDEGEELIKSLKSEYNIETDISYNRVIEIIEDISEKENENKDKKCYSQLLGECCYSMKTVAIHLVYGYNAYEISDMFSMSHSGIYYIRDKIRRRLEM